jgi:predicted Zn-dependent protease
MRSKLRKCSVTVAATTAIAMLALLAGCTVNPVTGERELGIVTTADEIAIGNEQYGPSRQMQGGDLVVDQELARYVAGVGQRLAAVSDRDLPYEFTVLNNSVPNAWALPGGKIAVNRGLLVALQSEAELAAVLGHEIVHAAARHGALAMQRGLLLQTVVVATQAAVEGSDYSSFAVGTASVGAQLINQRYSREAELEADQYGMRYMSRAGYDPQAAVSLQQTFVRLFESDSDSSWIDGLFASHPPSTERVRRNEETAATLPAGGEIGADAYRRAISRLIQAKPAYDAYDAGVKALSDGRIDEAQRLADEAASLVPEEGHFHALLGDVDSERGMYGQAIAHYGDAIARNDGYFYYYVRRGFAHLALDELDPAAGDLDTSIGLLPTADAYVGLGRIAERRGDTARAAEYYMQAAGSASPAGDAARAALARIEQQTAR